MKVVRLVNYNENEYSIRDFLQVDAPDIQDIQEVPDLETLETLVATANLLYTVKQQALPCVMLYPPRVHGILGLAQHERYDYFVVSSLINHC